MSAVPPIDFIGSSATASPLVLPPSSGSLATSPSSQGSSLVLPPSRGAAQSTSTPATSNNALVLPPSSNGFASASTSAAPSDGALVLPATDSTSASSLTAAPGTDFASQALSTTAQPLNVVFNALASAGVDNAITQSLLAPETTAATGTFSAFLGNLFDALAAQSVVQQAEQANADGSATATDAVNAAGNFATDQTNGTTSPANAFLANSNSTAPNSALESGVQNLAQSVNAQTVVSQTVVSTAVTTNAVSDNTLSPLQQSFDQFLSSAGGTPTGSTGLGGFLSALATNLHTAPTPRGNILDAQS